jgi:hypothetical protein
MRIKSHAPLMYVGMTAAGVITLAFMGIAVYLAQQQGRDSWVLYAFLSPFVLMGAALTFFGGRFLLRWARIGSWAARRARWWRGSSAVRSPSRCFPAARRESSGELTCHLRCIRIRKLAAQGSSAGRSDITTLWETTWTTRCRHDPSEHRRAAHVCRCRSLASPRTSARSPVPARSGS